MRIVFETQKNYFLRHTQATKVARTVEKLFNKVKGGKMAVSYCLALFLLDNKKIPTFGVCWVMLANSVIGSANGITPQRDYGQLTQ
ncbi:MAG: hypothetical protein R2795_13280 [Saprospiraceae bacterium]